MKVEAVVLANGEYPTAPLPLQILADAPYVVCCDGGADEYIRNGHTPNLIIGDGDSISEENRKKYASASPHCRTRNERPDQSRQLPVIARQTPDSYRRRHRQTRRPYVGKHQPAYGLYACRSRCADLYRSRYLHPCRNTCTFTCQPGQQVSIINFNARKLHGLGLVYPLSDFTNWWQGTLNECIGTEFTIEAEGEYLVFLNFPQPLPQSTR